MFSFVNNCIMPEITRHDIQEADARVGDSAQGLLGTIRETYTQKKHGIFNYLYVISIVFHICVFLLQTCWKVHQVPRNL